MATGYATFLKDSKNDIPADRILNLSPSNDDDEFILQSGANKNKEQPTGFLHELVKHAAACFTTDDVQDGVPGLRQPRDVLHRKRTQEEATTLACFAFLPSGYVSTRSMVCTSLRHYGLLDIHGKRFSQSQNVHLTIVFNACAEKFSSA